MATTTDRTTVPTATETAILNRIIRPDRPALPATLARLILRWKFPEEDEARMHELLEKAKAGIITRSEQAEAQTYERVGHLLSILKSQARLSLKDKRKGA